MAKNIENVVNVDSKHTIDAAMNDAMGRVMAVAADCKNSLIDSIPASDWNSWDASDENSKVVDTDPIAIDDNFDIEANSAA